MSSATETLLTGSLERKLRHEQLANGIANRNYEGTLGPESSVKVTIAQSGTVQDYTGGAISIEENVDATPRTISPDHKKAFAFVLDGSENLEAYAEDFAGETFAEVLEQADKYILTNASDAGNNFDFDQSIASPDVSDLFGQAQETLNNEGVPQAQRFAVVPASTARLVYDEIAARGTERGDEALMSGLIGRYYGFEVYGRPTSFFDVTGTSEIRSLFGSRFHQTYADTVVDLQVIENAPGYPGGTVIQGLHVAGSTLTQPNGFVEAQITE